MTFLNKPPCNATRSGLDGEVVALERGHGQAALAARTIGPSRSSPLVLDGRRLRRRLERDASTRSARPRARLAGRSRRGDKVTGRGRLFAAAASTSARTTTTSTRSTRAPGSSSGARRPSSGSASRGTFYSTPAVAYGRVYIGSTDGKVYSFGATSGKLRWSHGTGGYVYSSPAVLASARLRGLVHGRLSTASTLPRGDVRWKYRTNGPISGSPIVINGRRLRLVARRAARTASTPRTGKLLWSFRRGVLRRRRLGPAAALPRRLRADLRPGVRGCAG